MYVKYGDFEHAAYDVALSPDTEVLRTSWGRPYAIQYNISGTGVIINHDGGLSSDIQDVINAYSLDNKDFVLYFNDGTPTPDLEILASQTIDGVLVTKRPTFDPRTQANYSTYWEYRFGISAKVMVDDLPPNLLLDFSESIEFEGNGGPKRALIELKRGTAQEQRPRTNTICRASQSGFTVGLESYILPPGPKWPGQLDNESVRVARESPRRNIRGGYTEFRTTYSYQFSSPTPFPLVYPTRIP